MMVFDEFNSVARSYFLVHDDYRNLEMRIFGRGGGKAAALEEFKNLLANNRRYVTIDLCAKIDIAELTKMNGFLEVKKPLTHYRQIEAKYNKYRRKK